MTTTTPTSTTQPPATTSVLGGPYPEFSSIESGNFTRFYSYVEPDPSTQGPLPLLLAFHGAGGNMQVIYNALQFDSVPARPYLTVIPQGHGLPVSPTTPPVIGAWNSGQIDPRQLDPTIDLDDVAFIDDLLVEVTRRTAEAGRLIDQSRIYAVGFSNGGMMAYRLAAERSSTFAAIAAIGCSIGGDPDPDDPSFPFHLNDPGAHGAEPVSVLHMHGMLDTIVPPAGGRGAGPLTLSNTSMDDALDIWVDHNNCRRRAEVAGHPRGITRTWTGGDDGTEVRLLTMPGVAHQVPDGAMYEIEPFLLSHSK